MKLRYFIIGAVVGALAVLVVQLLRWMQPVPQPPGVVGPWALVDTLSPEAAEFYRNAPIGPDPNSLPLMIRRKLMADGQETMGDKQQEHYGHKVTVTESKVAGVPVRLIEPKQNRNRAQVLMNLHGGGFTTDSGSLTENIPIASLTGRSIVAVLYRLGPEDPYPAGIEDALAVYRELLKTHKPADIVVFGTSAGATMTAQLAVRLKQQHLPMPAALGMFSMISDFSRLTEGMANLNPLIFAPPKSILEAEQAKFRKEGQDPKDPLMSPLYADLKGLPPTLLMSGSRDLLIGHTSLMHRALMRAGVDANLVVFEAMQHAHWAWQDLPESQEAFALQARFIERRLQAPR